MTKQKSLTRICTTCGLEKPLAAFLQLSGMLGTHYGSVCATCRATHFEEDSTSVTTDKRIGSKEKVYEEQEKKRRLRELKESHLIETKKREEQTKEKVEKETLRKKAEQEHRKFYLDLKQKEGFLAQKKPQETEPLERHFVEEQHKKEIQRQEEVIKQEFQVTSLDFSKPFISGQTNQLRFQSDTFLKFKSWIGSSSPLVKTLELLYGKNISTHAEPRKSNAKENIENYIENRLDNKPSSSKKR